MPNTGRARFLFSLFAALCLAACALSSGETESFQQPAVGNSVEIPDSPPSDTETFMESLPETEYTTKPIAEAEPATEFIPETELADLTEAVPEMESIAPAFVSAVTTFSGDLFGQAAIHGKTAGKNLLLSPLSATFALTFTANGASGETLTEFNQLNGGIDVAEMNGHLSGMMERFASTVDSKATLANSLWADHRFPVSRRLCDIGRQQYGAEAFNGDFTSWDTVDSVNNWVSEKTDGMIKETLSEPPAEFVMLLINTILFDGKWESPYAAEDIRDRVFTTYSGRMVEVPMMYSSETTQFVGENYTGFTKAYTDGYEFVALLPEEGLDIFDFAASLDWTVVLANALHGEHWEGDCYLPKFDYEAELDLIPLLKELGLTRAFAPHGELTALADSGGEELYLAMVRQKARITVNETGTRAAAVTIVAPTDCIPSQVMLNRPFVYAIVDEQSGLPLFHGVITDPLADEKAMGDNPVSHN